MSHISPNFREASRAAVQNAPVIAAVRKTADILFEKRKQAVAELPDFEQLRDTGRARKLEISGNLEKYAELFADRARAAGAVVYRARDAAEVERVASMC
jgi:L-lactate dehydrogenase complex protein LldF